MKFPPYNSFSLRSFFPPASIPPHHSFPPLSILSRCLFHPLPLSSLPPPPLTTQCKNLKLYKDYVEFYQQSLQSLEKLKTESAPFRTFLEVINL